MPSGRETGHVGTNLGNQDFSGTAALEDCTLTCAGAPRFGGKLIKDWPASGPTPGPRDRRPPLSAARFRPSG